MWLIENNSFPCGRFVAITICEWVFLRADKVRNWSLLRLQGVLTHEKIHIAQAREMGYIFFYLWYFVEWLVRLCIDYKTAYTSISFEREAYSNQYTSGYLHKRKHYAWVNYLRLVKGV